MEEDNYTKHFNRELKILRDSNDSDDLIIDKFEQAIRDIIDINSKQGHSGHSAHWYANYLSNAVKNVMLFKPLSPLTGEDSEWVDVCDDLYQNNRCGAVFKDKETGKSNYIDAICWRGEEDYDSFSGMVEGISSKQNIIFPFTPNTFYVDVKKVYLDKNAENECDYYADGDKIYKYVIKYKNQLDEVFEYYVKSK